MTKQMTPEEKRWLQSAVDPQKFHRQICIRRILLILMSVLLAAGIAIALLCGWAAAMWLILFAVMQLAVNLLLLHNDKALLTAAEKTVREAETTTK